MSTTLLFAVSTIAFAVSWVGVAVFRRWSLTRDLLDRPNERSSHTVPTPRGGGLVIVGVTLIGYALLSRLLHVEFSPGYITGAVIVAGISWLDDLYSLPFWSRLIAHITASAIVVFDLGQWSSLQIPLFSDDLGLGPVLGAAVTVAWIVWLINAYNFMDGIDGIAGLQAVVASLAWLTVGVAFDLNATGLLAGLVLGASFGFLLHNWQPAKIFMGDVGSAFLGFTLAVLPILSGSESSVAAPSFAMLGILFVWFFVFDTVLTLSKRTIKRERIWEAHRQHMYQTLVIGGMSHATVTVIYGAAAAIVASFAALSVIFAGNYEGFLVFSIVLLTAMIVFSALWKKR